MKFLTKVLAKIVRKGLSALGKILVNQAMPGQSIKKLTATKATKADKPLRTILIKKDPFQRVRKHWGVGL